VLNERETELILESFFYECVRFWNRTVTDTREAFKKAIRDIEELTHDPYESCGKLIDIPTRDKFVEYRNQDLNIFQI
jgi:hypothetical protein